jgi:hypothetical protein
MGADQTKTTKKEAKAAAKIAKAASRAAYRSGATSPRRGGAGVPDGIGVTIRRRGESSELVVSGLGEEQLARLVPQVNREVLIAVEAGRSAFRAGLMRFVREGIFQTIVKVAAGLVVGYLLLRFGLR